MASNILCQSGKGSNPKNCFSKSFRDNHDGIDWGHKKRKRKYAPPMPPVPHDREVCKCIFCSPDYSLDAEYYRHERREAKRRGRAPVKKAVAGRTVSEVAAKEAPTEYETKADPCKTCKFDPEICSGCDDVAAKPGARQDGWPGMA